MDLSNLLKEESEIIPEVVAKRLNVCVCQVVNECLKLVKEGKLKLKHRVICPRCKNVYKEFESLMEIPDEIRCSCGYTFVPMRDEIEMVFKVQTLKK